MNLKVERGNPTWRTGYETSKHSKDDIVYEPKALTFARFVAAQSITHEAPGLEVPRGRHSIGKYGCPTIVR